MLQIRTFIIQALNIDKILKAMAFKFSYDYFACIDITAMKLRIKKTKKNTSTDNSVLVLNKT